MATYTIRGTSHNIVYTYKTIDVKLKQQLESYSSELEAIQRKAYIDYLQAQNRASDITHEAAEYRRKKAIEKTAQKIAAENALKALISEEAWSLYLELDAISNELESVRQEAMYLAGAADHEKLSK